MESVFQNNETLRSYLSQLILPQHLRGGASLEITQDVLSGYNTPGISLAVLPPTKTLEEYKRTELLTAAFGLRDCADPSSAVNADTVFQAASISKPFTAMAVLRLVAARKLDLDADIGTYLALNTKAAIQRQTLHHSALVNPEIAPQTPITLRLLLAHRSGLSTVSGLPGYREELQVPSTVATINGEAPANHRPIRAFTIPGLGTSYSGGGTTLVQHILMLVTGKPFPELMDELVLGPLGMKQSTYEQRLESNQARAHHSAHQAYPDLKMGMKYPEMAAAGLRTTPSDLARGLRAVYDCLLGLNDFLPSNLVLEAFTEFGGWGGYGVGWAVEALKTNDGFKRVIIGHGGSNQGFQCNLKLVGDIPTDTRTPTKPPFVLAWMTNCDYGPLLGNRLTSAFGWIIEEHLKDTFVQLYFPALARTPEEMAKVNRQIQGWQQWVGKWRMSENGKAMFEISEVDSLPMLRVSTFDGALLLLPAACYKPDAIVWTVRDMDVSVSMKKSKEEKLSLEVMQNFNTYAAERVE
uniref:Beta-lactamase-related domain-containing protein n=1 Tax=Mycena chlorophos TaxID=658473 RepID=A0ABQ0LUL0_MYCCL|nr:predicted protein [Mycena chlorophos]